MNNRKKNKGILKFKLNFGKMTSNPGKNIAIFIE